MHFCDMKIMSTPDPKRHQIVEEDREDVADVELVVEL